MNMPMMVNPQPADTVMIAALHFDKGGAIDVILEKIARELQANNYRIAGYLQRETHETDSCCAITDLENIASGQRLRISQDLGRGARGCRLDFGAMAQAAAVLMAELEQGVDLLVLNRFGKGESEGQGFRAVIQHAIELNVPVLTAVRDTYAPAWLEFGGEFAQLLPPESRRGLHWCQRSLKAARVASILAKSAVVA